MRVITDDWTIVVAGHWNRMIFTPAWLARNQLSSGPIGQEMVLEPPEPTHHFTIDDVVLAPYDDRLVIGHRTPSEVVLARGEDLGRRILELLPHTPVGALGVNFGFGDEAPIPTKLEDAIHGGDSALLAKHGLGWRRTELTRALRLDDEVLNLSIRCSETDWGIRLNFHTPVRDAQHARELLNGRVVRFRDYALDMMSSVYGLENPDVS